MTQYAVEENMLGRKIIVMADRRNWAWSGSRWVPHARGVSMSVIQAQISNFATEEEADEYAKTFGFEKQE
jgi:hypothetical protein